MRLSNFIKMEPFCVFLVVFCVLLVGPAVRLPWALTSPVIRGEVLLPHPVCMREYMLARRHILSVIHGVRLGLLEAKGLYLDKAGCS